jgi:hypothetical protein
MSSNKTASFPILGILGLIFVTLKLTEIGVVATWSWWWVLSPFWIPFAVALVMLGIVAVAYLLSKILK